MNGSVDAGIDGGSGGKSQRITPRKGGLGVVNPTVSN